MTGGLEMSAATLRRGPFVLLGDGFEHSLFEFLCSRLEPIAIYSMRTAPVQGPCSFGWDTGA
jgi:hypothetical protein